MQVNILTFGVVRDIVGASQYAVEVPTACTVSQLKSLLEDLFPALSQLSSYTIAVNGAYVQPDTAIKSGCEVAIIPPVSGG